MKPVLLIVPLCFAAFGPFAASGRDLPDPPPDTLEIKVEVTVGTNHPAGSLQARRESKSERRLILHRYSIRGEDYRIRSWNGESLRELEELPAVRTYRGHTKEDPNEQVVAVLYADGRLLALASTGQRWVWHTPSPIDVSDQVRGEPGTDDGRSRWPGATITRDPGTPPLVEFPPQRPLKRAQLAADIMNRCVTHKTCGDWQSALAWTEWQTSCMDQSYVRDLALSFELTEVIIRESKFYTESKIGPNLKPLSNYWKSERMGENWDYVNGFGGPSAGLSSVGGPFSVGPVLHEVGHSLSMGHGIYGIDMQNPVNHVKALTHFETRGLIDDFDDVPEAVSPDPVTPAANPDIIVTAPNTPVRMNVLSNDWDSLGSEIHISYFTERTKRGGEVRKISHDEKSGLKLDALGYIPAKDFIGKDVVIYQVKNAVGLHQSEVVHIHVIDDKAELAGHWPLNLERQGQSPDESPARRHVTIPAASETVAGAVDSGIQIPGGTMLLLGDADLLPERPKDFSRGYKSKWGWYPLEERVGNDFDPLNLSYTAAFWFRASKFLDNPGTFVTENGDIETTAPGILLDKTDTVLKDSVGFRISATPDGLSLHVREFSGAKKGQPITHPDSLSTDTWHHVAVVFNRINDTASLYLDGRKADDEIELARGSYIFAGRNDLRLVSQTGVETAFDEVQIAYRAMSKSEIKKLFEQGRPRP